MMRPLHLSNPTIYAALHAKQVFRLIEYCDVKLVFALCMLVNNTFRLLPSSADPIVSGDQGVKSAIAGHNASFRTGCR